MHVCFLKSVAAGICNYDSVEKLAPSSIHIVKHDKAFHFPLMRFEPRENLLSALGEKAEEGGFVHDGNAARCKASVDIHAVFAAKLGERAVLEAYVSKSYPTAECYFIDGGQDIYPYIFVAE